MKIPKNIANMVEKYCAAQKKADRARDAVVKWIEENGLNEAEEIGDIRIIDTPVGSLQHGDEYCLQHNPYEDCYYGTYCFQIEGSDKFVAYDYEC